MTPKQIRDAWNAQADDYNQWDALDEDEKLNWAIAKEREACALVATAGFWYSKDGYQIADDIRARNKT